MDVIMFTINNTFQPRRAYMNVSYAAQNMVTGNMRILLQFTIVQILVSHKCICHTLTNIYI